MKKVSGSLTEKHGKYYAVYRVDGKQKWYNLGIPVEGNNARRAKKAFDTFIESIREEDPDIYDLSFMDFLDMWLRECKPLIKPSTWEGYDNVVRGKIKPYFEEQNLRLCELRGRDFNRFYVYLRDNGRKDGKGGLRKKAVENIKGVLSSAFDYAVKNELMEDNVITKSSLPLFNDEEFEPTIYNAEQIRRLLDYAAKTEDDLELFLNLVMFTGARKGEVLALTWDDIDLERGTLNICKNRTGSRTKIIEEITTPKTKNGYRTIPLPEMVVEMLRREKAKQEENKAFLGSAYKKGGPDYVVCQADGTVYHPHSINRKVNNLISKAGLPLCRIHDFRHAVASILFESGASISDVMTQLSHGQTSTTEKIYIHQRRVAKKENVQVLTKCFGF